MLAEWLVVPLLLLFGIALFMPGWRALGLWTLGATVVLAVAAVIAIRVIGSDLAVLIYGTFLAFAVGAVLAGALVRAFFLIVLRPRPKH